MITSYLAIHLVEEFEGQKALDQERAAEVSRVADHHGVFTRKNLDGDTSYLEAPISLASLTLSDEGRPELADQAEEGQWRSYVEFLAELEDSNIGYLLHEVDTEREWALLATLLPVGSDHRTLSQVDVEYRISHSESET